MDTAVNESLSISYNLEQFLIVLSVSLSIATLSKTVPILRKIPYTLLLVIVGMASALCRCEIDQSVAGIDHGNFSASPTV
ncbi:hypothetical protein NON20_22000 [Synechocystis sp. B12]|nr:hypothetical protein NON20_22000 [Synechocystis sp. B12]